jgi:hypothetical protein
VVAHLRQQQLHDTAGGERDNVGALLVSFLRKFGSEYDYSRMAISLEENDSTGELYQHQAWWLTGAFVPTHSHQVPLHIQDPLDPGNDIGRPSREMGAVQQLFRKAHQALAAPLGAHLFSQSLCLSFSLSDAVLAALGTHADVLMLGDSRGQSRMPMLSRLIRFNNRLLPKVPTPLPTRAEAAGRRRGELGDAKSSLGDAKSSLGDAKSSLGDANSSLGDAKCSLGDAKSSLGDAESSLGDAKSSLGDAESSLGAAKSSLGDAKSSLGDAESLLGRRAVSDAAE